MKHVFGINVHRDLEQANRTTALLARHCPDSRLLVYYDGGPVATASAPLQVLKQRSLEMGFLPVEPNKAKGLIHALNWLVATAQRLDFQVLSLLHADMIPTNIPLFHAFLERFLASGCPMTFAPMWPRHEYPSFCDLHFNLQDIAWFHPVRLHPLGRNNEEHLGLHLDYIRSDWKTRAYPLWTIVKPCTGQWFCQDENNAVHLVAKLGHNRDHVWEINNYTPETSIIHTNDADFWDHYESIAIL